MLINPREEWLRVKNETKIYTYWLIGFMIVFTFLIVGVAKYPIDPFYRFGLGIPLICALGLGKLHVLLKLGALAEQSHLLGGRDIPRGQMVNDRVPETTLLSKRLDNITLDNTRSDNINSPSSPVPEKYIDPITKKIMNSPFFLGCHNVDYQTYVNLKEKNEAERVCPHPTCNKPLLFSIFEPKRNEVLEAKLEEFVRTQELQSIRVL